MSRSKRTLILILAALLFIPPALSDDNLIAPERIVADEVKYNTSTAEYGTFVRSISALGSEYYPQTLTVNYSGDEAVYEGMPFRRGQEVKKGDTLMRLHVVYDTVAMEEKALALERSERARDEELAARQDAIDQAETALAAEQDGTQRKILGLQLKKMKLQMEQAAARYEYDIEDMRREIEELNERHSVTEIISPMDGVITDTVYLRDGSRIYDGQYVCTIASQEVMLIALRDDRYRYGMNVTVETGTNREPLTFSGRVVAAADCIRNLDSDYVLVEADYPRDRNINWRNTRVSAEDVYVGDVLLVSRKGITMNEGKYIITRLREDGVTQKRYVKMGLFTSSEAWIVQGLEEGDVIIID